MTRFMSKTAASLLAFIAMGSTAYSETIFDVDLAHDKVGNESQFKDIKEFCGTKPMRVALSDGFGGNVWRKIVLAEFKAEAAKCPNITEVRYTDAQGDVQKHIADMQSLVAQHYDIIVLYPDGGEALLQAMRDATAAGVAVVPFAVGEKFPGKPGVDYLERVTEDLSARGVTKADWLVKAMGGKGNVVVLGGTAGNPTDAAEQAGWEKAFAKYPDVKVLEGPVPTAWTPSEAQKAMAGLLAKYDEIDGVFYSFGLGTLQTLRAFEAAGRKIPAQVTEDANALACYREKLPERDQFPLATISGRSWMVRNALRKGVAAVQGIPNDEPSIIELPLVEDSMSSDPKLKPKCDPLLPPDAILSTYLPKEEIKAILK